MPSLGPFLLSTGAALAPAPVVAEASLPDRPAPAAPAPAPRPPSVGPTGGGREQSAPNLDREVSAETQHPPQREHPEAGPGDSNVIVPFVIYMPETHFGLGAFFAHFLRRGAPDERSSSIAFLALLTSRGQIIFEGLPDFYFLEGALRVYGKAEYQHYPDSFWGIGNAADSAEEERYERTRFRVRAGTNYRVLGPFFVGVYGEAMQYDALYPDPDGIFATSDVPGEDGGFTLGLGPTLGFDSRDNTVATRRGGLANLVFTEYPTALGSRYGFRKLSLDGRAFFPLPLDTNLALHGLAEVQGGDVPYYHLAMLGGDELLRGYYLGRYRDKYLAAFDVEYRFGLFWKFGAVVFGGVGKVGPDPGGLVDAPVRWSVGSGLRFSLSSEEHLNLRLDFGIGPSTHGLYLTAKEAF